MTGKPRCLRCGDLGGDRLCDACTEAVAAGLESAAGLPIGGRDPEVVRREIRCRRAGAAFLLHTLTGDEQGREAAMRLVLVECAATPGLTPNALLLPQIVDPAKPSTVAAAAAKAGLEVLDTATVAALRHDAAQGRQLATAAAHAKVEASVDDAIAKGKITAPRRKHWVTLIEADPAMADVLAAIPNETAVPITEIGHSADDIATADKPAWFY